MCVEYIIYNIYIYIYTYRDRFSSTIYYMMYIVYRWKKELSLMNTEKIKHLVLQSVLTETFKKVH